MARLPTVSDFGGRPVPGNQRNVVPFRADIAQQAEASARTEMAETWHRLGGQLSDAAEAFEQRRRRQDAAEQEAAERQALAEAKSEYLRRTAEMERPQPERLAARPEPLPYDPRKPPEYMPMPDYPNERPEYTPIPRRPDRELFREGFFEGIPAGLRGRLSGELDVIDGMDGAWRDGVERGRRRDEALARMDGHLAANATLFAATQDPARRRLLVETSHDLIDALQRRGMLDPEQAGALRRDTAVRFAASAVSVLPPAERFELLQVPPDWDGKSELPAPAHTGNPLTDILPNEQRMALARQALPGARAAYAAGEAARIAGTGKDLEAQLAQVDAHGDGPVRALIADNLKRMTSEREAERRTAELRDGKAIHDSLQQAGYGHAATVAAARDIDDPAVRDTVLRAADTAEAGRQRTESEKHTALLQEALALTREGRLYELAPEKLAALPQPTIDALADIAERTARGQPMQSEPTVSAVLNRMTPEELGSANLATPEFFGDLSPTDYDAIAARQKAIRDGDLKARVDQRARSDFGREMDRRGMSVSAQADAFARVGDEVALREADTRKASVQEAIRDISGRQSILSDGATGSDMLMGGRGDDEVVDGGQKPTDGGSIAGTVARNIAGGLAESPAQIAGGAMDAVNAASNSAFSLAEWLNENVVDLGNLTILDTPREGAVEIIPGVLYWQPGMPDGNDLQIPDSLRPDAGDTFTGNAIRSATQFMVGYAIGGKALRGVAPASRLGAFAKGSVQGSISDALFFEAMDGRLADLVTDVPELAQPIHDFLKSRPGESEAEARFKRALEGFGLGVVTEGLLIPLRGLRTSVRARRGVTADAGPSVPGRPRSDVPDMPKTSEAMKGAERALTKLDDTLSEALPSIPKGKYEIIDRTKPRAFKNAPRDHKTNIEVETFIKELQNSNYGLVKETSEGKRYIRPDGAKMFLRENANSHDGPTADFMKPGKDDITVKYRLEKK
jgi:hypothetical protein